MRQEQDLNFGGLVVLDSAVVTVPPTGLDVDYRGAIPLGDRPTAAAFHIRGKANRTVEIQLPTAGSVHLATGGQVEVDEFSATPDHRHGVEDLGGGRLRITLDRSGENRVFVGGRIKVAGGSRGSLSAPFSLHASYVPESLGSGGAK